MKCDNCGKEFEVGNRPDGLPNGIGLQMADESILTLCADCVMKIGKRKLEQEDE